MAGVRGRARFQGCDTRGRILAGGCSHKSGLLCSVRGLLLVSAQDGEPVVRLDRRISDPGGREPTAKVMAARWHRKPRRRPIPMSVRCWQLPSARSVVPTSTPPLMCWPCHAPPCPPSSSLLTIPRARAASGQSFSALIWRLVGAQRERAGRHTREHQPSVYTRADVAQVIPSRCPTSRWAMSPTRWRGSRHSVGASSTPGSDGQSAETPRETRSA
jgi:hypothetical protein